MTSLLQCSALEKTVVSQGQSLNILRDINLTVNAGETVAIVGQSGSGKTTLLSLLAGMERPSAGRLFALGEPLHSMDEDARADLRNGNIGFVFQAFHLLPGFTALENVMLPLEINNEPQAAQRAEALLARVDMAHRLHHYPTTLSGGEQQRVAIARAFASNPPLLLADEPTGNLDSDTGGKIIDLLFAMNREQGTTLVLVTHDAALAARCQRRLRLHAGHLEAL